MALKDDSQVQATQPISDPKSTEHDLVVPVEFARAVGALMTEAQIRANPEATPLPVRRVRFVLT